MEFLLSMCMVNLLLNWTELFLVSAESREIIQTLLDETVYDANMPPGYEQGYSTNITVQFLIQNIHNVRESQMDYKMDTFFRQKWLDSRLLHNSSREKLELDVKQMDRVWVPDTFFANAKNGFVHDVTVPNKMMHIYRDGTVLYSIHVAMDLTCYMDLSKFPLEEQQCPIRLESYAYTSDVVYYLWNTEKATILSSTIEMPKFSLSTDVELSRCDSVYPGVGTFSCIQAKIHLHRKTGYFVLQLFVPSILIVALSWVSFWIDHESVPARISLGLLTVLTMTTQSSSFKDVLPHVSYVKAIDVWLASCLMFVFLALLEYAYVNQVARRRKKTKSNNNNNENNVSAPDQHPPKKHSVVDSSNAARKVDHVARYIFPLFFLLFNLFFWIYYLLAGKIHVES